jgi:hypothetical protein
MKSRSIRVALLSAFVLTSPSLIFAGSQPKLHMLSESEAQDLSGSSRAVQQGKGAGMSRNQAAIPANTDRSQTTAARDSAFRK